MISSIGGLRHAETSREAALGVLKFRVWSADARRSHLHHQINSTRAFGDMEKVIAQTITQAHVTEATCRGTGLDGASSLLTDYERPLAMSRHSLCTRSTVMDKRGPVIASLMRSNCFKQTKSDIETGHRRQTASDASEPCRTAFVHRSTSVCPTAAP